MKPRSTILDRIAMAILCAVIGAILAVVVWVIISYIGNNAKFHVDAFWFAVGSFATVGFIAGQNTADFLGIFFFGAFGISKLMLGDPEINPGRISFNNPTFFTFILLSITAIIVVLSIW